MFIRKSNTIKRLFFVLCTCCAAAGFSTNSMAWGHDGHAAVGILALNQLSEETRLALKQVLGSIDDTTIVEACNWPDKVRPTEEWAWSYPLHYINIPTGEADYSKPRDCPDQLCATEAIKKYALELGNLQASKERRQQGFAWACHLTGDLHQPLHAGFAHDRGGNDFNITYLGEQTNLHNFWDRALINEQAGDWQALLKMMGNSPATKTTADWRPVMVDAWTEESHELAKQELYPANPEIRQRYADKSWEILQQQITTAATRLALIIEAVL